MNMTKRQDKPTDAEIWSKCRIYALKHQSNLKILIYNTYNNIHESDCIVVLFINDNYYVINGNNVTLSNEDYKSFRIIHNLQFSSFEDNSDLHFVRIYKNTQFNYPENQQYINIIKKIVYETKN